MTLVFWLLIRGLKRLKLLSLKGMYNLRLLEFNEMNNFGLLGFNNYLSEDIKLQFLEGLEFPSNELRFLQRDKYPSKTLPANFCPENMAELRIT